MIDAEGIIGAMSKIPLVAVVLGITFTGELNSAPKDDPFSPLVPRARNHPGPLENRAPTGSCDLLRLSSAPALIHPRAVNSATDASIGVEEDTSSDRPLPGPEILYLRYDEDYTYLAGPEGSYRPDYFDCVKHIELGEPWYLRIGGEMRLRWENEENKAVAPGRHSNDLFLLRRYNLHADLHHGDHTRLFVELAHSEVTDRDGVIFFIHRNRFDLHQLFFDAPIAGDNAPWILRLGRQELVYGRERMMSASGWGRTRRGFEAVKLFRQGEELRTDFFVGRPVLRDESEPDGWDTKFELYGTNAVLPLGSDHKLEGYVLVVRDRNRRPNANGATGTRTVFTPGLFWSGRRSRFDYELEANAQLGKWARDKIRAWSLGGSGGYTFVGVPTRPRIGAGFEVASGDSNPNDNTHETFDQLFRQEKEFLGYMVLFGRQNLNSFHLTAGHWLAPKAVRLDVFYYWFALNRKKDAAYNPGGVPGRRDVSGMSGRALGREFDVTLGWQIDVHHSLLVGYSRFWDETFIHNTGDGDDTTLAYFQYQLQF